ncbi:MAG: WD40/YVTN/BNR-like repeat-containing protein, partial [Saprospiraceae bacterium]
DYGGLFKSEGADVTKWQDVGPMPYNFSDLQMVEQQLICNSQNWLFRSQDEGLSWEQKSYIYDLGTVVSLEDSLFRVGTNAGFYKSEDFGATWIFRGLFPTFIPYVTKDYVLAHNGSFYILNGGGLIVSKNRGKTWTNFPHKFTDPNGNTPFKGFIVNDIGVFVLWNHRVYLSPDDGKHWIDISENLPHHQFGSIAFVNNALLVADYQGNLWRRTDFDFVFNTLLGTVYLDENANGQLDAQERKISNAALGTVSSQSAATTDVFGTYALFYGIVPDTLRVSVASPYASINPPFHVLQAGDTLQNFGVQLAPNKQDFSVTLTNLAPFVPGFDQTILARVNNPGSTLSDGALSLTLDSDLQYLSAEPAPTQVTGNTIYWEFGSITPLLWKEIKVFTKTSATVPSGTPIELSALVKEINNATDLTPANNFAQISTQVVSSFDPNDKQVSPAVYTVDSLAQRVPLDYTVRFQNTGTYQASFVYVLDTLSPDLDITTFKLLASSHPVTVSARYGKVLEFFFDHINLSDTISNEAGSHGFVRYSIVPKAGLPVGSRILNTAHIYFDFNAPVVTNTVETVLGMVGASEPRPM